LSAVLLDARNVFKSFPGVRALNDVSISVQAGEILAIVGHNGSGKSTFVKVMAGVYQADSGEIICTGGSPRLGHHGGLHFIHQDLGLVATLTTIENLDLGRSLGAKALLPSPVKSERKHARALIKQFGAHFDVELQVSQLTPAERTIVAIARALDGWTTSENVLVLDEPTAALQDEEVGKLFEAIRRVASAGAGVILISHRLDEVVEIADRVVVLRDGCVVADSPRGKFDKAALVQLIAGQASVEGCEATIAPELGEVRLSVRQLRATQIAGLDIDVQGGEIVGITGLLGSGMEHVAGAIFGAVARESGTWGTRHPIAGDSVRS
jgi:ABC-type sugar transport system ATPase subunit